MLPQPHDPCKYPPTVTTRTITPDAALAPLPLHVQQALATDRPCPRCGTIDTPVLGPGAGQHYARLLCRHCQFFLQWLSQYSDAERLARRQQGRREVMAQKPPTAPQLAFLKALGDSGPPPANRAEASDRIGGRQRTA